MKYVPVGMAIVLATTAAHAQAPAPQQSSADLVCKLSGDCGSAEEVVPTRAKPRDRGFRVVNRNQQQAPRQAVSAPRAAAAAPQAAPRASNLNRNTRTTAVGVQRPPVSVAPSESRADLLITFVTASATLTPQAEANANEFVTALRSPQLAGMKFAIEGHTDSVGTRPYNLDLSQRRAQAVVDYLVSKGADRSQFVVHGYGFDRPRVAKRGEAAANRRVEVVKVK